MDAGVALPRAPSAQTHDRLCREGPGRSPGPRYGDQKVGEGRSKHRQLKPVLQSVGSCKPAVPTPSLLHCTSTSLLEQNANKNLIRDRTLNHIVEQANEAKLTPAGGRCGTAASQAAGQHPAGRPIGGHAGPPTAILCTATTLLSYSEARRQGASQLAARGCPPARCPKNRWARSQQRQDGINTQNRAPGDTGSRKRESVELEGGSGALASPSATLLGRATPIKSSTGGQAP